MREQPASAQIPIIVRLSVRPPSVCASCVSVCASRSVRGPAPVFFDGRLPGGWASACGVWLLSGGGRIWLRLWAGGPSNTPKGPGPKGLGRPSTQQPSVYNCAWTGDVQPSSLAAGPGQGKTGQGQTRPRLGTAGKPAKLKQAKIMQKFGFQASFQPQI